MWSIVQLINNTSPEQPVAMTDGLPIDARRGGAGNCFRMAIDQWGFLDIVDTGHQPGGPHHWQLSINDQVYWYDGDGALTITLGSGAGFSVSGDGNQVSGNLRPLPKLQSADLAAFDEMLALKIVPYQKVPHGGKSEAQIRALGLRLFPWCEHSFALAMAIYDWTTADFARMVFFKVFEYTGLAGHPLDLAGIANAIWTSNWPPYTPADPDFMNSFMMKPAASQADVQQQLLTVAARLQAFNDAENRILSAAFLAMPRTSLLAKPQLYSGQVDIQNLGSTHFAPEFLQFQGNQGPLGRPLEMPLSAALESFLQAGKTITTKMVWSFTDSKEDAMHYSNGILLILNPPAGQTDWQEVSYITTLSDEADKIEYTLSPGTSFFIQNVEEVPGPKGPLFVLTLQIIA